MHIDDKRLIAAFLAAHKGMKIECGKIAEIYGGGANYHTIRHKIRGFLKDAERLLEETNERPGADNGTPIEKNTTTPPESLETPSISVKNGKISKPAKSSRGKAAMGSAKKRAAASDNDEESQPNRKRTKASSKESQFNATPDHEAETMLDTPMGTSGPYDDLGLDMGKDA